MKKNLFLITVKQYNGTQSFHIEGTDISDASIRANDYMNQIRTPGVEFEIIEVKLIGRIVEPDYSLAP
jgi:hypothetical protein